MPSVEISADELEALRALAKAAPGLEAALDKSAKRVAELEERLEDLEEAVVPRLNEIERRLVTLEWRERKTNFLVTNLPEDKNETPRVTEKKVRSLMEEKLSLNNVELNSCRRIGKPSGDRPRRIHVTTASAQQKQEVMRRRTSLKGTSVYLDDDLPESLRQQRASLRRLALPLAKEKGERLTLSFPFISARVGQREYNPEELFDMKEERERKEASQQAVAENSRVAEEKRGTRRRRSEGSPMGSAEKEKAVKRPS